MAHHIDEDPCYITVQWQPFVLWSSDSLQSLKMGGKNINSDKRADDSGNEGIHLKTGSRKFAVLDSSMAAAFILKWFLQKEMKKKKRMSLSK